MPASESAPQPALFRAFPSLEPRLPRRAFVTETTPVEPFEIDGVPSGTLFVKRDDQSCPYYGGNKSRKLEFIVGAALARGSRRLVTTGGIGTNHGLATAILGRTAGLSTTLVLVHQPVNDGVRRAMLLHDAYGAELLYGRNIPGTAARIARVLARSTLRGERPSLIMAGGSSARGSVGFVSAGLELALQVRAGVLPEPRQVFVAVGTGGTLAGLVVGFRLAALRTRVVGVLVTDILTPTPASLARLGRAVSKLLHRADPSIPRFAMTPADFDFCSEQVGPGYGAATPASQGAVAAARAAGVALETTYTGKCLAEIRARGGSADGGPVLFWNTYNGIDVESRAPRALDPGRLPARFREIYDGPNADPS